MARIPRVLLLLYSSAGYDRSVLQGIARYAHIHGPWIFHLAGEEPGLPLPEMESDGGMPFEVIQVNAGNRRISFPNIRQWGATGVIGRLQNEEIARTVLEARVPVIAMDLSEEQTAADTSTSIISEICPDSKKAGRMAAEHLLERGFKNFGFCGYSSRIWSRRRLEGFQQRLAEAGFNCLAYQPAIQTKNLIWPQERAWVIKWLHSLPKPVGVMTCNDSRGRQVLEACTLGKMTVPDDVAVVGVDDDQLLCDLSNPSLSSVVLNAEKGGYMAAELLDGLMSRRKKKPRLIEVEPLWVMPRQSTDVVAVDDRDVAVALRFISQNATKRPIGVKDVVAEVALSRRALEIRFAKCLGRSIRDEIQRVRLVQAKRLLLETDMSAAKISETVGFNSLTYLSKVFHQETGETLARYRRARRPS